jgi:hypothetical protein
MAEIITTSRNNFAAVLTFLLFFPVRHRFNILLKCISLQTFSQQRHKEC